MYFYGPCSAKSVANGPHCLLLLLLLLSLVRLLFHLIFLSLFFCFSAMTQLSEQRLVKVCGVTNVEDASMIATAGANLIGVIFAEGSPRR